MADTALPFDDFRDLVNLVPGPDEAAVAAVRARDRDLTKPAGALGRMEAIVEWLAAWQGKAPPAVDRPLVAVFAANHGVTAQGVSAFPASVTRAMVENFAAGGAAINQICAASDIGLKVFELALDHPTPDISLEDAFDEAGCAATMAFGMEALAGQPDLLCLGEMGIGNTTVAAALFLALFGGEAADWVGPGTGVGGAALANKVAVVERAVARLDGRLSDPLEILRRLGGREIAAMAGAILAARHQKVPVVVDGFVTTAAAAVLWAANPAALDHCLFAHVSAEPAHARALAAMGKVPLLDLGMRLGEGTGAALAAGLVRIAAKTHAGMATFTQAGVAGKLD
ncbi:nicotinate-nucleotide--dimethylbenzimidazole phosphoribosyltransferase [Prosthecomicrobium hirschii]|uniref:Nicotinate-nucleotide--dimethylbenzimidazole phosphoribosyltransferase n=1 Tax=Prosthecodimorpha hirschii TaxID=665126 RepID=A0A0P6VN52_9HYPH|nr:nicotinate-nucleotide--dimethylbenzimidazole phosphoribosyltransferase [Prosthecomicrobium hirschii]KPL51666.1 nicotinate-nucleotide--dimethylbenzimidazole phosphoribosyltransferase [Prosthecomicrobium hirschii]